MLKLSTLHKACILFYFSAFGLLTATATVRLLSIFDTAVLIKFSLVLLILPLMLMAFASLRERFRLDVMCWFLIAILLWGLFWGLVRQQPIPYLTADATAIGIALLAYFVSIQPWAGFGDFSNLMSLIARITLGAALILLATGFFVLFALGRNIYFSLADITALAGFTWFLVQGKWRHTLAFLVVFLIGGKIGVTLAVLSVLILHIFFKRKVSNLKILVVFAGAFVLLNLFMFSFSDYEAGENNDALSRILVKILVLYNPYKYDLSGISITDIEATPIVDVGGSRVAETIYSMKKLSSFQYKPVLTGGGLGFHYDMWYWGDFIPGVRNAHFSPVSLIGRFGVPFTLAFYILIFAKLGTKFNEMKETAPRGAELAMFYFCFANILFSFTAYSIFNVTAFWFFFGLISNPVFSSFDQSTQSALTTPS